MDRSLASPDPQYGSADAVELCPGLIALPLVYRLDGRVSSHPLDARGFAPMNSYLLTEPGHVLLLESGLSVHERAVIGALESALEPGSRLSVWMLRHGEFPSVCNVRPIVERFPVDTIYARAQSPAHWVDFRPEHVPFGSPLGTGSLAAVESVSVRRGEGVAIGSAGRRVVAVDAPLRLLPVMWAYDEQTRTLFSADAFTYLWQPTERGPWVLGAQADDTDPAEVWRYLVGSRFWWLAGGNTDPLRRRIAAVFDEHDVETIAPAFGCILHGRDVVERHVQLIDHVLAEAAMKPSIGLGVGQWKLAARQAESA